MAQPVAQALLYGWIEGWQEDGWEDSGSIGLGGLAGGVESKQCMNTRHHGTCNHI